MASPASGTWTIGRLLEWMTGYFQARVSDSPRLDAEILLAHHLGCQRIQLYVMYEEEISAQDRARLKDLVVRRGEGCPVAYLTGVKEFFGLRLRVNPAVLIPRPETEVLVESAVALARHRTIERFFDLGTGSGAIAIALAKAWPSASGVASDCSPEALAVAKENAEQHQVADRIEFRAGKLFDAAPEETFDLIASNPPYVASEEIPGLANTVRDYEPRLALDGGPAGLEVLRQIIEAAPRHLRPGGSLLLEIGDSQEAAVRALFTSSPLALEPTIRDYSRLPRVLLAHRQEE